MEEKHSFSRPGDYRTAAIAMLTTVIVLALFHFGMGVVQIFTDCYEPKPQIILIESDSQGPSCRCGQIRHMERRRNLPRGQFRQERDGNPEFLKNNNPQKTPRSPEDITPDDTTPAMENLAGEK